MRILILSKEAWREEQNGGNVLSNMFNGFDAEFAQIYCNECLPNNNICTNYYQFTDKEMLRSIFTKHKAGKKLRFFYTPTDTVASAESFSGGKKWFKGLLPILREMVWSLGKWNQKEIEKYVKEFNPDIVFAPCYGSHYMHKLTRLVSRVTDAKIISYISDDHYSNNQIHFAPWYWINHYFLRKHTRDVFSRYSLVYTMTQEQKEQCEKDFGANMKILRKIGDFESKYLKTKVNNPIRIVYAGGIYLNRWRTLKALADAIKNIDPTGNTFKLDIYTNNQLTQKMKSALDDKLVSTIHPVVSLEKLKDIYHQSDIALHCESFDLFNRQKVRMSFSTKIVDCLDSGCAVMAICDSKQAGLTYLRDNDAAICISSLNDISKELMKVKSNPELIMEYQHKAFKLGRKNHNKSIVQKSILQDFEYYSK